MSYYDSDEGRPHSPGLKPWKPSSEPSSHVPSFTPRLPPPPVQENVSARSSSKRKRSNRVKARPSQGDSALLTFFAPDRPDIAQFAGNKTLLLSSSSESGSDDEMDSERGQGATTGSVGGAPAQERGGNPDHLMSIAQQATHVASGQMHHSAPGTAPSSVRAGPGAADARIKINTDVNSRSRLPATGEHRRGSVPVMSPHGRAHRLQNIASMSSMRPPSPRSAGISKEPRTNGFPSVDSIAASPLRRHTISHGKGSPGHTLPALQSPNSPDRDNATGSPGRQQSLPGFQHLSQLAEAANQESEVNRANGFHRASFSSAGGQRPSPTFDRRTLTNGGPHSARSPPTPFPPLLQTSPISAAHSDASPSEAYLKNLPPSASSATSGLTSHAFFRRPSQTSESGGGGGGGPGGPGGGPPVSFLAGLSPASATTPSTSAEGYSSSDAAFSPSTASTQDHRMSIDGVAPPVLPLPQGMPAPPPQAGGPVGGVSSPSAGTPGSAVGTGGGGGFKCEHPGCTAPPFQTQYLLNSHANVHSQNRPHYCPVPGCPRAEGGRGFKRKNEMIRHGLVHDSPGYVCPFCPDREHKYPRPDNLQRHVRVHHVDKDKDDPQLREVLAQRPEGGNRGRRRRMAG